MYIEVIEQRLSYLLAVFGVVALLKFQDVFKYFQRPKIKSIYGRKWSDINIGFKSFPGSQMLSESGSG